MHQITADLASPARLVAAAVWLAALVAVADGSRCPFQCRCTSVDVICACREQGTFMLTDMPAGRLTLVISNCHQVLIHGNPFNDLSLDRVLIHDSENLQISDINFLGMRGLRRLKLSNIANLTIGSLYSLKTDLFEANNVTIQSLGRDAIPGRAEIKEMRITDSRIGTIHRGALHFQHDSSLDIIDTDIGFVEKESVCIDHVQSFTIRDSRILEFDVDALNLIHVGKVVVSGNTIHTINDGTFLADEIGKMFFVNNEFRKVLEKSFFHMQNIEEFTMSENRFHHVSTNGILLHIKVEEPTVSIEGNTFYCDCGLRWLWAEFGYHKFDKFFQSSTCYGPDDVAGLILNAVTPLTDALSGDCLRVVSRNGGSSMKDRGLEQSPIQFEDYLDASSTAIRVLSHLGLIISEILYLRFRAF